MKRIVILFSIGILIIFGCSSPQELEKEVYYTGFDFTKYTSQNFLFTPEIYLGGYESIGLINVIMYPEVRKVDIKHINQDNYTSWGQGWSIQKLKATEAIDSMYVKAIRMGANAIVRLTVQSIAKLNGYKTVSGLEVSGFAIKRK